MNVCAPSVSRRCARPWPKKFNLHSGFNLIRMIFHQAETSVRLLCECAPSQRLSAPLKNWKPRRKMKPACLFAGWTAETLFRSTAHCCLEIEIRIRSELKSHFDVHFIISSVAMAPALIQVEWESEVQDESAAFEEWKIKKHNVDVDILISNQVQSVCRALSSFCCCCTQFLKFCNDMISVLALLRFHLASSWAERQAEFSVFSFSCNCSFAKNEKSKSSSRVGGRIAIAV